MKIARSMLRQWATTTTARTSRSAKGIIIPRASGLPRTVGSSSAFRFCTGVSPDLPVNAAAAPADRSFSSLHYLLTREAQEEVENGNTEMPEELSDLRKQIEESWSITEEGPCTTLVKRETSSGKTIQLSFHCQDTLEVDDLFDLDDDDEEEELEGGEGDEDEEDPSPVRFTVTVAKDDVSLNFACFSEFGEVKIEGVSTTASSSVSYVHDNQGSLPKLEYQGPDFAELAEDVQEGFANYLEEECGVDSDVAAFVAMATDFREEINYVDFLKQAQSVVS